MWLPTIRNGSSSLPSHLAFMQFAFSLPMALLFGAFAYEDGRLTLGRGIRIVVVCGAMGVAAGLIGWYVILVPLLRKRGRRI
jgi:hypothetical protein